MNIQTQIRLLIDTVAEKCQFGLDTKKRPGGAVEKSIQIFTGDEWENLCLSMLQDRHGALNVHKVPASDAGDLGIDYYCLNPCTVYQCYAVEEPTTISARTKKQKTKIADDIRKLLSNSADIFKMLHKTPIEHWVLLVPNHDSKQLNQHCAKKTEELKKLSLPHLAPNFCVAIQDLDHFPNAAVQLGMGNLSVLNFDAITKDIDSEDAAAIHPPELLKNLYRKLEKRVDDGSAEIHTVADHLFKDLMKRDNVLERLRIVAPELYEKVQASIRRRLKHLQMMGPVSDSAHTILKSQFDELCAEVRKEIPNLSEDDAQMVAYGTICSWLMLCPLDFPPYENAA